MSFLTDLKGLYARWLKGRHKRRWEEEFKILLRRSMLPDPFNQSGLELALLHINAIPIQEPSAQLRRSLTVYSSTRSVDQLLYSLTLAERYIQQRDNIPKDFFPDSASQLRKFDDYFVSGGGHIVSIEIHRSIEGRLQQLFTTLGELEAAADPQYGYYIRKLYPLYRDVYYVLHSIHAISYQ